jgi:CDP-diacylglycerol--glycerol-3-phosphate 3-phosphatidyltransferase
MIGRAIGTGFARSRDALAGLLVRAHLTPNALTLIGAGFTTVAGVFFALGGGTAAGRALAIDARASAYPLLAFSALIAASACDMLDGAVARLGGRGSTFGAFLDSTIDRYSDFVIYAGIGLYFARQQPANLTFGLLAGLAFFNAVMISYTRARAEDLIDFCTVGYWQRGERSAAVLIATAAHNLPALLVQQAFLPALTVLARVFYTRAVLAGRQPVTDPRHSGWRQKIRFWKWPRMSVPYDLLTAAHIAWLIFAPVPAADPLRSWLGG